MIPDERELRRALDARSGAPTEAFRARLFEALAEGSSAPDPRPALAAAAAALLALVTVGVFLLARGGTGPGLLPGAPAGVPTASVTPARPVRLVPLPPNVRISAPGGEVVWVLAGPADLFRSTDRGSTWQRRPLPFVQTTDVTFMDDHEGWVCGAQSATIWHTADGGATWQALPAITPASCRAIRFLDRNRGLLFAADPNDLVLVYRTSDGGRTWSAPSSLPDPPGPTSPNRISFVLGYTPITVRAFGSTLLAEVGPRVFRSTDDGATWTYAAAGPDALAPVALVSVDRWLQLVGPGQDRETDDGGATWHAYASDYSPGALPASRAPVVFAGDQVGYAAVRSELRRTSDGGAHWNDLPTPGTG